MRNALDAVFESRSRPRLMAHVVAGYPDLNASEELVALMAASGADLVEIQIPFSDPLADGPTITRANHEALRKGVRPADCFRLVERLRSRVSLPLILMTYANIPYQMGMGRFAEEAAGCGASGAIVPDLPFDEVEGRRSRRLTVEGVHLIPVLSPGMSERRLEPILAKAGGLLYITLRVGITGVFGRAQLGGADFIDRVRKETDLPIAAGFGVSSAAEVSSLGNKVDAVVIGSRVLDIYNSLGPEGVAAFLRECRAACEASFRSGPGAGEPDPSKSTPLKRS